MASMSSPRRLRRRASGRCTAAGYATWAGGGAQGTAAGHDPRRLPRPLPPSQLHARRRVVQEEGADRRLRCGGPRLLRCQSAGHVCSRVVPELDYRHEASNLERFQAELVPRLGGKCTSPSAIGVSRVEGARHRMDRGEQLAKSPPEVINRLISTGVACFLAQLLDVGFFHSDPHPGNLLVDARGRLVLIDFGLCAEIEAFDTRHLTSAIVNLMRGDVEGLGG